MNKKLNTFFEKINNFIDKYGIYLMLLLFFVFVTFLTFSKHLNFQTYGFDLGIFDQTVYKYSNGIFPAGSSIREISNMEADHFHPILGLYALFYKIYASPLVLIFVQNLAFVLGGLGIYKIAKLKKVSPTIGFLVVFLYLIFKGNINALFFDFHPLVVAVSLFPWLFYFSLKKNWIAYFLLLIPILLTKENLSIYIIFFGIYQFFIQKERLIGILSFLVGAVYFYMVMNIFLPAMGGAGRYWSYDAIGANPKELIINSITHPIDFLKVVFGNETKIFTYLFHLTSGLLIAIFSPVIILLIPAYAQKFLSSREEFWTLSFHYSIDIYWVIAIGIIFVFAYFQNKKSIKYSKFLYIIFGIIFIISTFINLQDSPLIKHRYGYFLENKSSLKNIIKNLPKNVKLSTQNAIVPHFSHNNDIYIFPDLGNSEYILINEKIDSYWPLENKKELDKYINLIKNKQNLENIQMPYIKEKISFDSKYKLISEQNGILLFQKITNN